MYLVYLATGDDIRGNVTAFDCFRPVSGIAPQPIVGLSFMMTSVGLTGTEGPASHNETNKHVVECRIHVTFILWHSSPDTHTELQL